MENEKNEQLIEKAKQLRWQVGDEFHDQLMESIYRNAAEISSRAVSHPGQTRPFDLDRTIDRIVTNRWAAFPIMFLILSGVFWLTIIGANVPSALLASLLVDTVQPWLKSVFEFAGSPWWLTGVLVDGGYLAGAWVVSVMLPPMAIFFPLFTLFEDFGYLPRVAFNMDNLFRRAGAHGRQALTMSMGFGCNAAGIVATRIIDSPRERLIAMITNNFSLCNGRWPTQILIASIFIGSLVPAHYAGIVTAGAVVSVALFGIFLSLAVSWGLSRTVLRGQASSFTLELPPYRPPRILQTLYTSFIDRTLIVLWRAVLFAFPAGLVIWLVSNIPVGDQLLATWIVQHIDPLAVFFGLNGVIFLAYIIAIPANEIVIPTILMLTIMTAGLADVGAGEGVLFETDSVLATADILKAGGWTTLTGINLMLFSLMHNPCSTTIYTIYKESKNMKWTLLATFLPIFMGLAATFFVTQIWRIMNW